MSTKFILLCIVLSIVQHTSFALNCYDCSAGTDGCGTSFHSKGSGVTEVTQSAAAAGCAKVVYVSNTNAIDRSSLATCTAGSTAASDGVEAFTLYCCTTDLCNGTTMKSASIILAVAVAALSFFYIM